jgi:hypothetical protein
MQVIHPELGDITHIVEQVLREGLFAQEIAAIRRQRELARMQQAGGRHALGRVVARMDPVVYAHWQKVAGEGCFADKAERESILTFAPELRVREERAANRVGGSDWYAKAHDAAFSRGAILIEPRQAAS